MTKKKKNNNNKPKCANCVYYRYDRIDDIYACAKSSYLIPTAMADICSSWHGESDIAKRSRYEAKKRKLEHCVFPSAEERRRSF